MTVITRDSDRARLFNAGRQQTRQINQGSASLELAQTQVALEHYKKKLLSALETQDTVAIDQCITQLITLRSTQCALRLKQYQEKGQTLTPALIKAERHQYAIDCAQLIAAATT